MSEHLRNSAKAVDAFDRALRNGLDESGDTLFTKRAPCEGWTGTDVVQHGLGNLKMVRSFAATGHGPTTGAELGKRPLALWERLRGERLATLGRQRTLQRTAHEPFGPDFGSVPVDPRDGDERHLGSRSARRWCACPACSVRRSAPSGAPTPRPVCSTSSAAPSDLRRSERSDASPVPTALFTRRSHCEHGCVTAS